jgi:cell division inhibitor SepF
MAVKEKFFNFFHGDDDYEEYVDYQETDTSLSETKPQATPKETKVMSLVNKNNGEKKIMIFEPRVFSDVKAIATRLLNGQAAVVNFQRMDDQQAHRVVDFLSGVVLAVDGKIQRIGEQIFLCTPNDYVVEGDMADNSLIDI